MSRRFLRIISYFLVVVMIVTTVNVLGASYMAKAGELQVLEADNLQEVDFKALDISDVPDDCLYSFKISDVPDSLKILAVGNSLSYNTLFYVYDIAESLGIKDVVIGNLYIGSCSVKRHWKNAKGDKAAYEYHKNVAGVWNVKKSVRISEALCDEDWDYVMLSQYSGHAGVAKTYKPLKKLVNYVKNRVDDDTKIIWNMMWAYQGDYKSKRFGVYNYSQKTMYKKIVKATKKKVLNNNDVNRNIAMIIPSGTVIQNARKSSYGDTFTKDGRHMTRGGCYCLGVHLVSKLMGIKPSLIKYRPKKVSRRMRKVAIRAARKTIKTPYKVS